MTAALVDDRGDRMQRCDPFVVVNANRDGKAGRSDAVGLGLPDCADRTFAGTNAADPRRIVHANALVWFSSRYRGA